MKRSLLSKLIILVLFILGVQKTQAQNNWDGDSALGNFSTFIDSYKNWVGDTFPAAWNSTTDLSFVLRNNPSQTTMYLDYGTWKDCRNITYQASYLAGLPFDADGPLYNENGLNFYGKIENYSPNFTHTFNTIPVHGKNATQIELNPINGGLAFNRPILNGGNVPYRVYGPNGKKLTINTTGYPAGNGSVSFNIEQYSIVEMDYNNPASLSGGYFVKEGELWINSLAVLQSGIQVGNGNANFAKLYISHASTPTTVANAITVPTNSPNVTIGALNTSNLHTYSGTINLNNNDVNFDVVSAGGSVAFTNTISGTGGLRKISPGLVRLSGSSTYTGKTVVNQGTLQYGAANAIADASNVTLNGGKFSTGFPVGFSDTVGTLALTDDSTIELGSGNNILTFAASNGVAWTPLKTLTITGWTNDCAGAKVFVGNNNTGLTATQLAQITFSGYAPGASISPIGELIPGNIVLTATSGTLLQANYATLKAAFDAINITGTHTGVIAISVLNDTNEGTATAALNQVVGVTSVSIQPGGCGPRVISGTTTAGAPMVDFNGADNVTVDGLNMNGNSLTFSNNTISAATNTCTIRFQTDATNNIITNCSVLGSATMASGTFGGNICFGANSTSGGNDNNTISNCNIGPAGTNLPTKGIYFSGTPGNENSGISIDSNNIYDFFSATVASAGIDIASIGTNNVSMTNNRFFQTATRTQTTASTHSCVRIANASGNGFVISGNTFGYSASVGTGTYNFVGIANSIFLPITISVASASIQGNTIAGISFNTSTAVFSATNMFSGINVTAGNVNIGNTTGNTIGLPSAPITFNATAGVGGTINAINMTGTGAVSIDNNVIQSISTSGVAGAAYNFTGITFGGSAAYSLTNNTIGNTLASDSINIGSLGVSNVGSTFTGINASGTGVAVNIGAMGNPNTIQNITMNAAATNNFTGISTSGSTNASTISYNNVNGIRFASASTTGSTCVGITNTIPVSVSVTITNNNLGNATTNFVSYAAGCSGALIGIRNSSGSASPAPVTISNNDIQGISHLGVTSSAHTYISNLGGNLGLDINNNTFTNLNVNTTGTVIFISNSCNTVAASTKNINNNNIITGYVRTGTTGTVNVFTDSSASATNAITNNQNNNFSNITIAGSTAMTGWVNTDGGQPTKNITSNTFNNWTLGSGAVTAMNISNFGGTSSVSSNTISNVSTTGNITGLNIGTLGSSSTLTVNSNTIANLISSGSGNIIGITNSQPATTLINNTNANTISGLSSATGSVVGITNSSASPTKTISNNTISSLSNTGNLVTAINSSNGSSVAIATNTISSISSTSVTATSIVSAISVTGGSTIAITNNPISTLTSANNGSFRGIYVNPLGATSNTITGNTINNMLSTSTGTGFSVRAIEVQGANNATISSNAISNITSPTTNVSVLGVGIPIVGIYYGSSGTASTINSNTISNMNATATSNTAVSLAAIVTGTAGGGTMAKNKIYGLTNTTLSFANNVVGIVPVGGSWTFANNMISLINNNTVQTVGIYDAGAAGTRNYYYNSIYIGGAHTGAQFSNAFQFNPATGTANIINNIFVNERTSSGFGKSYAIRNGSASFTGMNSNYNILNSSNAATVALSNVTDQTFAAWKTASGGDANSYTAAVVSFVNTAIADLHITSSCTDIESGGTPLSVTDDYDATARNATTPDIGADEFTGTRPAVITLTPDTPICSGSSTTLTATSTDLTYVYTWSPATGLSATTGASVTASPIVTTTYTVTGTAPSSCVKTKDVTITVNPLPAPITVAPSTVNICPNIIQTFTATPAVSTAVVGTDTGTSLSATTPYQQSALITSEVRTQYLITKAELNAAGMSGGNITSLAFTVKTVGVAAMPSYIISMANTLDTVLTGTYISTGFNTVFTGTNILPVLGLNTHTFQTPFMWDGTSNVVVNICHTSSGGGTLSGVAVSTFAVAMTNKRSGAAVCSVLASIAGTSPIRPMMTIGFENPITWSPTTELYTDALATIAYNPLLPAQANLTTVYSKPTIPRVYTASSTNPTTSCASTSTGTITMNPSVWNGSGWLPSTPTGNTSLSFTGSYTSSANLSGCSCTVTGGDVLFKGGVTPHALILSGGLTVTAPGTLKFENNASLVQTDDASTNSGEITVERITQPMYRYDYTYWGTPMTLASNFTLGTGVNSLSPLTLSDKYFSWIPSVATLGGNWVNESIATVMNPIKGYCVRAPQTFSPVTTSTTPYTTNFIGTPNNGIISSPIYHGTLALVLNDDKYNLIGNPYPSAIDAQAFLTDPLNTPIIDGTVYFWTHNSPIAAGPSPFYGTFALNYNNNDYAAWNSLGAVGFRGIQAGTGGTIPNGFIATGQGFFTRSKGIVATGATVTFKNSMRVIGNNNMFFRNSNSLTDAQPRSENTTVEKSRIWLDLISNSGKFSQILVGYLADATLGWDSFYDGVPIDESGMLLYSIIPDRKLVIQGRPLPFEEEDQVSLGFKSTAQDIYTFGLDAVDGLFENQNIYIEDRDLNIVHDLKQNTYTFTAAAGTFNDRFVLRYTDAALSTQTFNSNENVIAFIANHELQINSTKNITNITLYDISGKLIQKYVNDGGLEFKTKFSFAQGVYLAKIKLDNGIEVTKKIVH